MNLVSAIVALVSASGVGAPLQPGDHRVAVVVGSNIGLPNEAPLAHAEDDAKRMHALLTRIGGVRADRAALVVSPSPRDVVRAIDVAHGRLHELSQTGPATFILYVSAHADAGALHFNGESIALTELRRQVENVPADLRLIVIDACRTPPVGARLKGGRPGPPVAVALHRASAVKGTVVISATGMGAPAQEWDKLRGGLFTHHLMTALRGVADFDHDGRISLVEAYTYAYRLTSLRSVEGAAIRQRPSFEFDLRGHGQWTFAQPSEFGAELILGAELTGNFSIADRAGGVVAEVAKRKGEIVRVAVLPEQYRVLAPAGPYVRAADVTLTWGGQVTIQNNDLVRLPARRVRLRGREPIVARPWRATAGYGLAVFSPVSGIGPLHVGELGIERVWGGAWVLRASVGATAATLQGTDLRIDQQEVRFRIGGAYELPLWVLTAGLGLEIHPRLVLQQISRDRASEIERVFGLEEANRSGLHLGLSGLVYLRFPLVNHLSWAINMAAGALWSRDPRDGEVQTGPLLELRSNLSWAF